MVSTPPRESHRLAGAEAEASPHGVPRQYTPDGLDPLTYSLHAAAKYGLTPPPPPQPPDVGASAVEAEVERPELAAKLKRVREMKP